MTDHLFRGLGVSVAATRPADGQLIPFQPDPNGTIPFSFAGQIAEGSIQINILWNAVDRRYWTQVKNTDGSLLTFYPLTATPSQRSSLKINMLIGVSASVLYFYEDIQAFHLSTPQT